MVFHRDLEANQFVIPSSNYHMRMPPEYRLQLLFDGGEYETIAAPSVLVDPLKFRDERRYTDRLKEAKQKTSAEDAVVIGAGQLDGIAIVVGGAGLRVHGRLARHGRRRGGDHSRRTRRWRASRRCSCSPPRAARACRRASCR